jgi:hypothetical protein
LIAFFANEAGLSTKKMALVRKTVEVFNEEPITGRTRPQTIEEVRQNITDVFATQNRAVTREDYHALALMMPQKYGSIKRANIIRDPDSLKRNLNMYILSEDQRGYFTTANPTIKRNLKVWLGRYKMMTDTIDILDAKIVNIGINYKIRLNPGVDKFNVLTIASGLIARQYQTKYFIGEVLSITDIWNTLNRVAGILDVKDVKIITKTGTGYSKTSFNIEQNMSPDGRLIATPKNVALELKFPSADIVGTVV